VKRHSREVSIIETFNLDKTRTDPWNPAPNLLYMAERGDDAVLCFERLFDCDDPLFQTVANVIDYIRQALEVGTCTSFIKDQDVLCPARPPLPSVTPRGRDADGQYRAFAFSTSTTSCIAGTATRTA
jgi:hypothetical protein